MKALNRQRSEDWQFFHTTFLFNNSGKKKKKKMQRLWVNGSAKLLCQDPSEKDGRDHPQWCITLPSIMNTSGYHQDLWGCAVLTDSAEPLTSCLWTFSCLFEQDEHFFVAVVLRFFRSKTNTELIFPPAEKLSTISVLLGCLASLLNHFSAPGSTCYRGTAVCLPNNIFFSESNIIAEAVIIHRALSRAIAVLAARCVRCNKAMNLEHVWAAR